MYYKIQPEQIEIHNFSSPSGDVDFLIGSNYVYANLSRTLTGDFNFIGDLLVNGVKVDSFYDSSNFLSGDNSFVFGGSNNQVSGTINASLNAEESKIGGQGNVIINSKYSSIHDTSSENTIIGGRLANVLQNTTGSMILKDSVIFEVENNINNSLSILFDGGNFIKKGGLIIEDGDLKINDFSSGLFSGNLNVLGNSYFSNRPTVNGTGVLLSGETQNLSGLVYTTGNQLIDGIKTFSVRPQVNGINVLLSGEGSGGGTIDVTNLVTINTDQTITSNKDFSIRPTINGTGVLLIGEATSGSINTVFLTGDQIISGIKTFSVRPEVNGLPVLVSGDGINSGTLDPTNLVTINTTQLITANKDFSIRPTVNGSGVLLQGEGGSLIDTSNLVNTTGNQIITGLKIFKTRPTVNGSGVLLSGDGAFDFFNEGFFVTSTTEQVISGKKTFSSGLVVQKIANPLSFRTGYGGKQIDIDVPTIYNDRIYTLPDVGNNASFLFTAGSQIISGEKTFTTPLVLQSGSNQLTFRTGVSGNKIDISAPKISNGNYVCAIPDINGNVEFIINSGSGTDFKTRPTVNGTGVALISDAFATYGVPETYSGSASPISIQYPSSTLSTTIKINNISNYVTLMPPSGGTEGCRLELWFENANNFCELTINSGIKLPTTAAYTPYLILEDKSMYIIEMRKRTNNWVVTSMVGGFE